MGIFDKFKKGFQKSASAFSSGLKEIIIKKDIDDENLNKIEYFLIQSDVGIEASSEIRKIISAKKVDPNKNLTVEINLILKEYIISLMKPLENSSFFIKKEKLNATLVSGVNGVGKTTSIGKIGKILKTNGNKVMFAASDTFRAAAIEQLENWANKIDVQITKSSQGSDPASVAFDTLQSAKAKNADVVIIDTAGRLHNKVNLMNELTKIRNVMAKVIPDAPHDVMLVLDASTGQNAIEQAKQFTLATKVDSLALSKLDGTAKGGVVIGISDQFKIPVRYIGVGEGMEDLQVFNTKEFVDSLFN